jgi:hypothetical protein
MKNKKVKKKNKQTKQKKEKGIRKWERQKISLIFFRLYYLHFR